MISIIATLTVACGDNNADSGAGLTREEVREIVRAEMVALTPVPGLTRPEVEEAIRTALAGMPAPEPGLTQADAAAAIQAALARVPECPNPE